MFGIFILDQEEAVDYILFSEILQFFTFILGSNFLLPQRANNGKVDFTQLQNWMGL